MKRIITIPMDADIIDETADFVVKNFSSKNHNFERVACVFGGKRPAMFLRAKIAKLIKSSFIPPKVFGMDDFIDICAPAPRKKISNLDATYLLYTLAGEHLSELLKGKETYPQFLPWASEVLSFIEQLDLEDIHDSALVNVQHSADIGYDVPENINLLLRHIVKLRRAYHEVVHERGLTSRGLNYLDASRNISVSCFKDFDAVIFCGFFYLHKCEERIIHDLYAHGKAVLIFQGTAQEWPVLGHLAASLNTAITHDAAQKTEVDIKLYQGFDMHSQIAAAVEIIKDIPDKNKTVVVLPRPESLIPLLSQTIPQLGEFNVSMGYPLKRSSLYVLFELLFKVQESRRENIYYTKDYLNLIRHPLVKNIAIFGEPAVTRILAHRIEDFLTLANKSPLAGKLFISLEEIEGSKELFEGVHTAIVAAGYEIDSKALRSVVKELHYIFLRRFDEVRTFNAFAQALEQMLDILVQKSIVGKFPFNIKAAQKLYDIHDELEGVQFSHEHFSLLEIWQVVRQYLESALVSFTGSPLKGAQVLGLFETRSLVFDDVVIMDANEGLLPKIKIHEPLIPREVMLSLGLNRLEKEEEIQRYQFMRLVSGAKRVHLIYEASGVKEKSRFIEDILWCQQKNNRSLEGFAVKRVNLNLQLKPKAITIAKDAAMVDFLRNQKYSSSRIDRYLNCPLSFYYHYCLGLREAQNLLGNLESRHVGTFIHEFLESALKPFLGKAIVVDDKFRYLFRQMLEERFEATLAPRIYSEAFLLKKIIQERMESFLNAQTIRPIKRILSLEQKGEANILLDGKSFAFEYTADRVDELIDGSIEIIDYKTGSSAHAPKGLKDLEVMEFSRISIKDTIRSFQLPLYYHFVKDVNPDKSVNALLYNIRSGECTPFIKPGDRNNVDAMMHICRGALGFIFNELLDVNVPFTPHPGRNCDHCPFRAMCI